MCVHTDTMAKILNMNSKMLKMDISVKTFNEEYSFLSLLNGKNVETSKFYYPDFIIVLKSKNVAVITFFFSLYPIA